MRTYPKTEDQSDVEILNAEQWQIDLLKLNPEYVFWGCFEDYMSDKKGGWNSAVILNSWKDHWGLDELNELVNFYFEIYRKNHECEKCEGSGLNQATKQLSDDWYDFAERGRRWDTKITDVEVEALMRSGRLRDVSKFRGYFDDERNTWVTWDGDKKVDCEKPEFPTAEAVNIWAGARGIGHDAINKWICVKARANHLGVYGSCDCCTDGRVYDEPNAKVALQLWYLHPRKGCSRGVYIEDIKQEELPEIFDYLKEAATRNQERFSKVLSCAVGAF